MVGETLIKVVAAPRASLGAEGSFGPVREQICGSASGSSSDSKVPALSLSLRWSLSLCLLCFELRAGLCLNQGIRNEFCDSAFCEGPGRGRQVHGSVSTFQAPKLSDSGEGWRLQIAGITVNSLAGAGQRQIPN